MRSHTASDNHYGSRNEHDPLLATASMPQLGRPDLSSLKRKQRLRKRLSDFHKKKSVFKGAFRTSARGKALPRDVIYERQETRDSSENAEECESERRKHSFLYSMLNPNSRSLQSIVFKRIITLVILVDLVLFIISTDERYKENFMHAEGIVSWIFLVEYIARLATVSESRKYSHPVWGRLTYMRSWSALVDLLATAPWFLERVFGWELPTLTYLRFFRLVRILKTEGYVRAMDTVYRVVYYNGEILYVASLLCVYLVLFTAVLLYYFRPPDAEDNSDFSSIASTMYLSALILTGQGGPDQEGLPWYTRALVLITAVFSIPMFAIPASMLTWGFEAEAERMAKQSRRRVVERREREIRESSEHRNTAVASVASSSTSSYYGSDGNTTDEEYFKVIAGEEDDSDSDDSRNRELREKFKAADMNKDGNLTLREFLELNEESRWDKKVSHHSSTSANFEERLNKLEAVVASNTSKLDRILSILERRR